MSGDILHRLGFLYPGHAAEDDYPRIGELLSVSVSIRLVHTSVGEDAHRVDALLDLGSDERLRDGAQDLLDQGVDAVIWACTSGSFVFGWDGAAAQVRALEQFAGVPASSTSFAFVRALEALGARKVAVAATYPEDVALRFAEFLGHAGVEVLSVGAENIVTAEEVGTFGKSRVLSFVTAGNHPDADAVLVPDTALHSIAWIDEIELVLERPVLTANQVTAWEALRLVGALRRETRLGTLFDRDPARISA